MIKILRDAGSSIKNQPSSAALYFIATPHGNGSVWIGVCGVNTPVAGVIEYSERVEELRLVTIIQVSSLRIAIEVGNELVATVAGVETVSAPVVAPTLNTEIEVCPVSKTYRKFA